MSASCGVRNVIIFLKIFSSKKGGWRNPMPRKCSKKGDDQANKNVTFWDKSGKVPEEKNSTLFCYCLRFLASHGVSRCIRDLIQPLKISQQMILHRQHKEKRLTQEMRSGQGCLLFEKINGFDYFVLRLQEQQQQ